MSTSWRARTALGAVLVAALCAVGTASAADAEAYVVNVTVSGHGAVTGDGINCSAPQTNPREVGQRVGDCTQDMGSFSGPLTLTANVPSGWEGPNWVECSRVENGDCRQYAPICSYGASTCAVGGLFDTSTHEVWVEFGDRAPPETSLSGGPNGTVGTRNASFNFSSSEPGSTFSCRIWKGGLVVMAPTACSSGDTFSVPSDGDFRFEVSARDPSGNTDQSPASRSWTVDTTGPQGLSIDSGPNGPTNDTSPTFDFSSTEAVSSYACQIRSPEVDIVANENPCSSPYTPAAPLAEGDYQVEIYAYDGLGNPSERSQTFEVDTTPPETTIDTGPSGDTGDSTPTFEFQSEAGASFECRVDSGNYSPCSSPHTTAQLADGQHTFRVRATDQAGNTDSTPAARTFSVDTPDTTPPDTAASGASGLTNDSTPTFSFAGLPASDAARFQCRIDGQAFGSCSGPGRSHTPAPLPDGVHVFRVRAIDAAGNVDPTPASRSVRIDTRRPETTITSGPSGRTTDRTPTFRFTSSEAGSRFKCSLDGARYTSCASPLTTARLSLGRHRFKVRAVDRARNSDATPAVRSFKLVRKR